MDEQASLTYIGHPAIASALAQMLEEQGLTVEWERPIEERSAGTVGEAIVEMTVSTVAAAGLQAACRAAYRRLRERFPGAARVTSRDVDLGDDQED